GDFYQYKAQVSASLKLAPVSFFIFLKDLSLLGVKSGNFYQYKAQVSAALKLAPVSFFIFLKDLSLLGNSR
ncbi:MAG: hypothetical protein EAZ85_08645, partial [Bacteroidetes bacterium]